MDDTVKLIPFNQRGPYYQLFISITTILGLGFILAIIFILLGMLIFGSNMDVFGNASLATEKNDIAFLKFALMIQTISLFIVPGIILLKKMKPENQIGYPEFRLPTIKETGLVIIVAFCVFAVTGFTGELNEKLNLPDWLSGLEEWITKMEDDSDLMMKKIFSEVAFPGFLLNLVMIAVLPAIGEEIIFRGIFQKIFVRIFKSGHAGVWVSAVLFSAMHLEFLGFLPRLVLGVVFGYLYLWSGKLWLPVVAHFVNNAVPTIVAFIAGYEEISSSGATEIWKYIFYLPIPLFIITIILRYFKEKQKEQLQGTSEARPIQESI